MEDCQRLHLVHPKSNLSSVQTTYQGSNWSGLSANSDFISSIKGLRRSDKIIDRNFSATDLDSPHYQGSSINPHRSTFYQLSIFVYNKLLINREFFFSVKFVSVPLSVLWRWSYLSSLHLLCSAWFCCRTSHNRAAWVFANPRVRSQTPVAQNTTGTR